MSETVSVKDTRINKEKIEKLQKNIWTKEGQFKRFKHPYPLLTWFMQKKILKLKEELASELEKSNEALGGKALASLNVGDPNKVDMKAYETFIMGTDENMNPVVVDNLNMHLSLFGGSGSGKSVFLFNLMRQVLEAGGAGAFLDGKGDAKMFSDFLSWANKHNRLDDVYILDFIEKDERKIDPKTGMVETPTTNTFNIFKAIGVQKGVKVIKEVIAGKKEAGGKNDFFKEQALNFYDNCALIMKYMDFKGDVVNLQTLQETLSLQAHIIQAIPPEDPTVPMEYQRPNMALVSLNRLDGYEKFWIPPLFGAKEGRAYKEQILDLMSRQGYYIELDETIPPEEFDPKNPERPQISPELQKQIGGYAAQELAKLSDLSNAYSHIFNGTTSDINFRDAITQNKLVYVRIPKMNVKQNASRIGSLVVNSIVDAVADSLGDSLGSPKTVADLFKDERLRASPTFLLVLDELGAFVQDSFEPLEQLLSQARSVNISAVISSQEIAGLFDGAKDMFKDKIMSNTATKVFLKVTDDATKQIAFPQIDLTKKEMDENGQLVNKFSQENMSTFLAKANNGLGVIQSAGFAPFLTSYHTAGKEDRMSGIDILNK